MYMYMYNVCIHTCILCTSKSYEMKQVIIYIHINCVLVYTFYIHKKSLVLQFKQNYSTLFIGIIE